MAAGNTYTPIKTFTLSNALAEVSFTSIPNTYTDLVLVFTGQFDSSGKQTVFQFNGDNLANSVNYSDTLLGGTGTAAESGRDTNKGVMALGYMPTANAQIASIYRFMNYSNTTTYKTVLSRYNDAAAYTGTNVGLWRSTAAINSMRVLAYNGGNFNSGSTFSLYGIAAA